MVKVVKKVNQILLRPVIRGKIARVMILRYNNIKKMRWKKRITIRQLAQLVEISKSHLEAIESNITEPGVYLALRFSVVLETRVEELFHDDFFEKG